MLNRHIFAPVGSLYPWRMVAPALSITLTSVAVKVTEHPASQNIPMLSKLLGNVGMM